MNTRSPNMIWNVTQFRVDLDHLAAPTRVIFFATISKGKVGFSQFPREKSSGSRHLFATHVERLRAGCRISVSILRIIPRITRGSDGARTRGVLSEPEQGVES